MQRYAGIDLNPIPATALRPCRVNGLIECIVNPPLGLFLSTACLGLNSNQFDLSTQWLYNERTWLISAYFLLLFLYKRMCLCQTVILNTALTSTMDLYCDLPSQSDSYSSSIVSANDRVDWFNTAQCVYVLCIVYWLHFKILSTSIAKVFVCNNCT